MLKNIYQSLVEKIFYLFGNSYHQNKIKNVLTIGKVTEKFEVALTIAAKKIKPFGYVQLVNFLIDQKIVLDEVTCFLLLQESKLAKKESEFIKYFPEEYKKALIFQESIIHTNSLQNVMYIVMHSLHSANYILNKYEDGPYLTTTWISYIKAKIQHDDQALEASESPWLDAYLERKDD